MISRLFFLISIPAVIHAATPAIPIENLAYQLSTEKEKLLQKEQQKRNVLGELYSVNKDLKKINSERSKIEKGLKNASENVHALGNLIRQLDMKIAKQRIRLRERMKALSKVQGQGVARLIFGSHSSAELDANLRIFRIVTEKDFRLMRNYQENVVVFGAQKSKLDYQENRYASLKKKLDVQEKTLAEQMDRKSTMLKTIDSSRILHIAKLKKLRLESAGSVNNDEEIKKIKALEDLFRPQLFERKGELSPPVQSKTAQTYGFIEDDATSTKIRFKGQLYDTVKGQQVVAVFPGTVAYAGWLDGYGRTVIVDHGDHYFTVYANTGMIEVNEGQAVSEGQKLALTTDNESFLGKGFYFEIRHFSEPEDPHTWLKETGT